MTGTITFTLLDVAELVEEYAPESYACFDRCMDQGRVRMGRGTFTFDVGDLKDFLECVNVARGTDLHFRGQTVLDCYQSGIEYAVARGFTDADLRHREKMDEHADVLDALA